MTARFPGVPAERLREPGEVLRLWIGVLTGPLIALAEQVILYALAPGACARGHELSLHLTALLALLLIAASGVLSLREWRRVGAVADDAGGARARGRFMAAIGMLTSIIFGLMVAAHWLATVLLGACANTL